MLRATQISTTATLVTGETFTSFLYSNTLVEDGNPLALRRLALI